MTSPFSSASPILGTSEYSDGDNLSDGEIYRNVRHCERERDLYSKGQWMTRLSRQGKKSLELLDKYEGLKDAFDNLLDIPGLWEDMRLSTLYKLTSMKCNDEVIHYLKHIKQVWDRIVRGNMMALRRVDRAAVKALELRVPKYSRQDAQVLQGQLLSGQIFREFSQKEREAIWLELLSIDCLIPSLFTFFEDVRYLDACANCIKRLAMPPRDGTVAHTLTHKFVDANQTSGQCIIEVAESSFAVRPGQHADRLELGRRQLWIYAMRHYQKMPADPKQEEKNLLAKAGCERVDETVLYEYAALAGQLGFVSDQIKALKNWSPDRAIARSALLKARKPGRYLYDDDVFEANINQVVMIFRTASPLASKQLSPSLVSSSPYVHLARRCGFPDKVAYKQDVKFLFLENLHDGGEGQGQEITSFFVRRSVYLAFFGKPAGWRRKGGLGVSSSPNNEGPREALILSAGSGMDDIEEQQIAVEEFERREQKRLEEERLVRERLVWLEQERLEREWLEQEGSEQQTD